MISPALGRTAQKAVLQQCFTKPVHRRGLAAAASATISYQTSEAGGIKIASRDVAGPTTYLALVAKAGTRYQPRPGLTEALEKFAFKSTKKRSALRITRETELLGAQLVTSYSRENLVIGANFLREDLPYIVELLAEITSQAKYTRHEFQEEVVPTIKIAHKILQADAGEIASDSAHSVAYHRGLGIPLHSTSSTPLTAIDNEIIGIFSHDIYAKSNLAIVANGTSHEELSKWVDMFFGDSKDSTRLSDPQALRTVPSKYHGGEERIAHASGNNIVIALPGSGSFTGTAYKPEISVLAELLGGETSIKWSPGFSLVAQATKDFPLAHTKTLHSTYSDAGLLQISISGHAFQVRLASFEVAKLLRSLAAGNFSEDDFKRAVAAAKFKALDSAYTTGEGIELAGSALVQSGKSYQIDEIVKRIEGVKGEQLKETVKSLLAGKATVSTVGDLFILPFAEEMELKV